MEDSNRTDEDQNPNEKLGRNSLEKGEGKLDKAGTEEQVNMVRSSNEDGSASKKEKLSGKAGGPKKAKEISLLDFLVCSSSGFRWS
ncbi:uncharacterized protein LOC120708257 isoform X2 [Panicum virgatum]|uniref:uncharacterized protein LOC120708257 isoform X2 n=1 Tax=Panicum virgatum TaxID=38727 RepID=UPI0019D5909D|nr:uncharacterized protein LOC120708257 isoform X2 [Panicum virgatum]